MNGGDPIRLAVLISGGGTTLLNLAARIASGELDARSGVAVASSSRATGVARAAAAGVGVRVEERRAGESAADYGQRVFEHCRAAGADLVCLAGWLNRLAVPKDFAGRVMNIHPALLPAFGGEGMYGRRVHEAVLRHGCKVSGCTVHFVDDEYDNGPIILQRCCAVEEGDTPESLAARVFEQEKLAYPEAIRLYAQGRLRVEGRVVRVAQAARGRE